MTEYTELIISELKKPSKSEVAINHAIERLTELERQIETFRNIHTLCPSGTRERAFSINPCAYLSGGSVIISPRIRDWQKIIKENYGIDDAPAVDAEPIRHGEWELRGNDDDLDSTYYCSQCNFQLDSDLFYSGYECGKWIENNVFKYCPNCGAKMGGERKEDDS